MGKWRDFFKADGGVPLTTTVNQPTIGVTVNSDVSSQALKKRLDEFAVLSEGIDVDNRHRGRVIGGWHGAVPLGHMCLPPDIYEDGWGPGSQYVCPACGCPWLAEGIRMRAETYRWFGHGAKMAYGPKRWTYNGPAEAKYHDPSGEAAASLSVQEGLYDWRDSGEGLAERLDEVIRILARMGVVAHSLLENAHDAAARGSHAATKIVPAANYPQGGVVSGTIGDVNRAKHPKHSKPAGGNEYGGKEGGR